MSHIVTVTTKIRDAAAVCAACRRLQLPEPVEGVTKLFSGKITGLAVQLSNWRFAIVCDTVSGDVRFDNYQGRWGDQKELDRFLQAYACERAMAEARRKGHSCTEQLLADGSIKLTINVGGAT